MPAPRATRIDSVILSRLQDLARCDCSLRTIGRTVGPTMRQSRVDHIKPESELCANSAKVIEQARSSGRPDELELLRDIRTASQQIDSGNGVANLDAKAQLRSRFRG